MDLLELIQQSTGAPPLIQMSSDSTPEEADEQRLEYIKQDKTKYLIKDDKLKANNRDQYLEENPIGIDPSLRKSRKLLTGSALENDSQEKIDESNENWIIGNRKIRGEGDSKKIISSDFRTAPNTNKSEEATPILNHGDEYSNIIEDASSGVSPNEQWTRYTQTVTEAGRNLAKNLTNPSEVYRRKIHINTNLKMLGHVPNPMMLAEAKGSAAGELAGGAQKLVNTALSSIGGAVGGKAGQAMSWLNWTCPSSAFVLPPGVSWVANKGSTLKNALIPSGPSDASLASSIGNVASAGISFAENFNTGYSWSLIKTADNIQLTTAGQANQAREFIFLGQDSENGNRVLTTVAMKRSNYIKGKDTNWSGKVYHFGLRQQGSDLTGMVLREKRADITQKVDDFKNNYDKFTFYEFTYPLTSSTDNNRFRGALTNINFSAGKSVEIDFLIHKPKNSQVPAFAITSESSKYLPYTDLSYACTLEETNNWSILGWDRTENVGGINQGRFGTFQTYRRIQTQSTTISMRASETEDFDFYNWMYKYYCYYHYIDDIKKAEKDNPNFLYSNKVNMGYQVAFTNEALHRSPYESYYYLELGFMRSWEPEFRHAIYMAVPEFSFSVQREDYKACQSYTIVWHIIGQVKTNIITGEEEPMSSGVADNTPSSATNQSAPDSGVTSAVNLKNNDQAIWDTINPEGMEIGSDDSMQDTEPNVSPTGLTGL